MILLGAFFRFLDEKVADEIVFITCGRTPHLFEDDDQADSALDRVFFLVRPNMYGLPTSAIA